MGMPVRIDDQLYEQAKAHALAVLDYEYDPDTRMLLLLGSHENFYRELKRSVD